MFRLHNYMLRPSAKKELIKIRQVLGKCGRLRWKFALRCRCRCLRRRRRRAISLIKNAWFKNKNNNCKYLCPDNSRRESNPHFGFFSMQFADGCQEIKRWTEKHKSPANNTAKSQFAETKEKGVRYFPHSVARLHGRVVAVYFPRVSRFHFFIN